MTLDKVRERMADFLQSAGLDAATAWPEGARRRRSGAVVAVSVRSCEGGPGGFQDYLGERYNSETGRWEELYGKKMKLTLGLDIFAPQTAEGGGGAASRAFDQLAQALQTGAPEGLRVRELSGGETEYDQGAGLLRCPAEAVCEGYLYAVADEGGAFLDFEVRGDGRR